MKIEIDFQTTVDKISGDISLRSSLQPTILEFIKTKEECVKNALISLGWTPPKESTFNWKDVKPGMAFKTQHGCDCIYYACPTVKPSQFAGVFYNESDNRYWTYERHEISRTPERDLIIKSS